MTPGVRALEPSPVPGGTRVSASAFGVTGTDTGVGKTIVAAALVAALRRHGARVGVFKPVETGVPGGMDPPDAALLRAAAGSTQSVESVCPFTFVEPLAPMIAAERAGTRIDLNALDAALARASADMDATIVEGAGGLLVPMTEHATYATLFARWRLGIIVVAANRLGVLNHSALTVHAAESAGLRVHAVVLNTLTAAPADLAASTNADALRRVLPGRAVVTFPYLSDPHHIPSLAGAADSCGLLAALPLALPDAHRT
jgi:dethiobiotin synthetase